MCWESWDDQLTEESEDMFGDVMWNEWGKSLRVHEVRQKK
jgi:hypothetical protein